MAIKLFPTHELTEYKNEAHKIFCGAEAFLLSSCETSAVCVDIATGKRGIYIFAETAEKISDAVATGEVLCSYQSLYLFAAKDSMQAFATELYLKCLVHVEKGEFVRGHGLKTIYEKLSQESKDKIASYYSEIMAKSGSGEDFEMTTGDQSHKDFMKMLNSASDKFKEMRYIFETGPQKFNFSPLGEIALAVRKRIMELRPQFPTILNHFP